MGEEEGKGRDGRGGPRACPLHIISGYATGSGPHGAFGAPYALNNAGPHCHCDCAITGSHIL